MKVAKQKTKVELLSLDNEGQVSVQDNYLGLDDIYMVSEDMVDSKTWDFVLKSGVSLREASFLKPVYEKLRHDLQNLSAKQLSKQEEAMDLYLAVFKKADFLGQNRLWNLMEQMVSEEIKYFKPEFKRLVLKTFLELIPYCLTYNLRGEFLIWLLPADEYSGLISKDTPRAFKKLLDLYTLFSRKQLFLLLRFAFVNGVFDLESEEGKKLSWYLHFGPEYPRNNTEQMGVLHEARRQESNLAVIAQSDTNSIWEFFQEDTEENRLAVIEYFRREIADSSEDSTALLELLQMFGRRNISNTEKFHILRALSTERNFYNPIEKSSYKAVDYLALMELFNAYPNDRDLIMVYLSDHKEIMEGLKAQLVCELEALKGEDNEVLLYPYEQFQKNYREWYLGK